MQAKPDVGAERLGAANRAHVVAAGILLSRVAGLVRESFFAHYLGDSAAADAYRAAFRAPNILQNLLGEGALSASFIPVYSRLLSQGSSAQARRLALRVAGLVAVVLVALVAAGIFAAPYLLEVVAPGFRGERRSLAVVIAQVLFPSMGFLVLSAFCLGVLNSHQRFFSSYAAPVAWNAAIVAALAFYGPREDYAGLAVKVAWGAVVGAVLQLLVQLPQTLGLIGRPVSAEDRGGAPQGQGNSERAPKPGERGADPLAAVLRNLGPVVAGRGAAQISSYVDTILASLLPTGAVAALGYARTLYMLPVSLFGMAVAAAELPSLSRLLQESGPVPAGLRSRLESGLRQIAFLVVPSACAFVMLGDALVAGLFQSGVFTHADVVYVWLVLAGSSLGLLASTESRLYNSAFYGLNDTVTPFRFALLRFALTLGLGYVAALVLPGLVGMDRRWGAVGLTSSAGVAAWVEFALLRRALSRRLGAIGLERRYVVKLWLLALIAGLCALAAKLALGPLGPRLKGFFVIAIFAAGYLVLARLRGVAEASALWRLAVGRLGRRA